MSSGGWVVAIFLAVQPAGAAKLKITVQVHNAAHAPQSELRNALGQANFILGQAGIKAQWLDCGNSVRDGVGLPGCQALTETGLFVVSIVSEDPRGSGSSDVLGFAVLAGRGSGAAVVYSRIVSKLKDNPEYTECNLLGHVIAHELGHLLLRSPHHGEGIMKADWNREDFAAMRQRRLKFSLAEARRLESMPLSQTASAKIPAARTD